MTYYSFHNKTQIYGDFFKLPNIFCGCRGNRTPEARKHWFYRPAILTQQYPYTHNAEKVRLELTPDIATRNGLANRCSTIMTYSSKCGGNRNRTCTAVTPSTFSRRISSLNCVPPLCTPKEIRTPKIQILSLTCIPFHHGSIVPLERLELSKPGF